MSLKDKLRKGLPVPLEAFGETVYLRYWTYGEYVRLCSSLAAWQDASNKGDDKANDLATAHLTDVVISSVVDEAGKPCYQPDQIDEVMELPRKALEAIHWKCLEMNIVTDLSIKAAKKKSPRKGKYF